MKKVIVLTVLFYLLPVYIFGWSRTGHQIVSEIAMHYLDPDVRTNVLKYLNGTTPEEASVWMDEMRSDPAYDYMKPWHYINVEKGEVYKPSSEENIINEIDKVLLELDNKNNLPNEQVKTDLMILFHLLGDLHQPLHVGYGIDKGGNTIQLSFNGHSTNLHHVWDDEIIQNQHITLDDCLKLYHSLSADQIESIKKINIVDWMTQSRSLLEAVYNFNDHKIDNSYAVKMKPIIEKQLLYAGIRLASILEKYFKTSSFKAEAVVNKKIDTIETSPEDAAKYVGQIAKVCGKVYGGKYLDKSNGTPTLINMGAAYPDSPFTFVIFGDDRPSFSYKPEKYLDGKKICVIGRIKMYKDKPEIVVNKESQIVVK